MHQLSIFGQDRKQVLHIEDTHTLTPSTAEEQTNRELHLSIHDYFVVHLSFTCPDIFSTAFDKLWKDVCVCRLPRVEKKTQVENTCVKMVHRIFGFEKRSSKLNVCLLPAVLLHVWRRSALYRSKCRLTYSFNSPLMFLCDLIGTKSKKEVAWSGYKI